MIKVLAVRLPRVQITMRQMFAVVAMTAVACAALPYVLIAPVQSLSIAALMTAIAAAPSRGRYRRIFLSSAISLACLALLAAAAREIHAMWWDAATYRRLADKHANHHLLLITSIPYFDKHPDKIGGPALWEAKRRQWLMYAEYDARLSLNNDRAARYPWLGVKPAPHPEPWQPPEYDPLSSKGNRCINETASSKLISSGWN